MANSMILDGISRTFHLCPGCARYYELGNKVADAVIPVFYSEKEARESGWRQMKTRTYSETGKPVWVCPDCSVIKATKVDSVQPHEAHFDMSENKSK